MKAEDYLSEEYVVKRAEALGCGGGPAYPHTEKIGPATVSFSGLTKREYFAKGFAEALAGSICKMEDGGIITHRPTDVAEIACVYADALLAELAKEGGEK